MSAIPARGPADRPPETEAELLAEVAQRCWELRIWAVHLDGRDARRLGLAWRGWPDLVMFGQTVLAAELKSERHRVVSGDQRTWRRVLERAGVTYALWTPADWIAGRIQSQLEAIAPRRPDPGESPNGLGLLGGRGRGDARP